MLSLPGSPRLFLYHTSVSMQRSFEGLSSLIQQAFPGELLSGAYFIFFNRQRDRMKVFYWDVDGFVIYYKRLEKGTFSWKEGTTPQITHREFLLLLEGVTPQRLSPRLIL